MLSLLLHAADISHPTKQWSVHSRWTKALMEEFFRQVGCPHPPGWAVGRGDHPLGTCLPCLARGTRRLSWGCPSRPSATAPPRWWPSPRSVSGGGGGLGPHPVPSHQPRRGQGGVSSLTPCPFPTAGFIDFIVEPTFSVLTDVAEKMVLPVAEDGTKAKGNPVAGQQARSAVPSCLSFPFPTGRWWGSAWGWGTATYFGTWVVAVVALPCSQLSPSLQLAVAAAVPGREPGAGGYQSRPGWLPLHLDQVHPGEQAEVEGAGGQR